VCACALFNQPLFDTAAVVLPPNGGELTETNSSGSAMMYYVNDIEDGQVEFSLVGTEGPAKQLSRGSEVLIPPDKAYVLKNHSKNMPAKLITVVSRPQE
jgi:hypothetical protein